MQEILIPSSVDSSLQPSLFFHPSPGKNVPLVVGLHTWSFDRFNQQNTYLPLCQQYGWALLLPEFRGPNLQSNPIAKLACGSTTARQDIFDAIHAVCRDHAIDTGNIFLLGCSGGGHMALLAAADQPHTFRAVDVWCPVTDLHAWYSTLISTQHSYPAHIAACLGGTPQEVPEEYRSRSPQFRADDLAKLPVRLHHGRHDDLVPFQNTAALAAAIELAGSNQIYPDIFDGGHEQIPSQSFDWFARLARQSNAITITG